VPVKTTTEHSSWGRTSGGDHKWLVRHYPKRGVCETCGDEGYTEYAFLRHPEPHTRNREDYREVCRSCHSIIDKPARDARVAAQRVRVAALKEERERLARLTRGPSA
jgi:hypothetical protein